MIHILHVYSDIVFLYVLCRRDPWMSLVVSFLLSIFSGIVNCKMFVLCFISRSHLGVSTYYICLSGSGLTHSFMMFFRSSNLPINFRIHYFYPLCSTPLCKYTIISLSILQWRGCFQVLAVKNNVAVNIVEHLSL